MSLHPGSLLGLPPGVPDPTYDAGWWRDLLLLIALAAGWLEWRGRRRAAVALAVVFAELAIVFWVLALGRPYGVLVDTGTTRWAGDVAVAAGGGADGFVVGEPPASPGWARAAAWGVPARALLLLPTLLPLVVVPLGAWAAWRLAEGDDRALAAIFWLAGATGSAGALEGHGVVSALWGVPRAGLAFAMVLVVAALLGARLRLRAYGWAGAFGIVAAALSAGGGEPPSIAVVPVLLLLDPWPWMIPAALALRRDPPAAALPFVMGGAAAVALAPLCGPGTAWVGVAAFRLGVLVLAARGARLAIETVAARLEGGRLPARALTGALVSIALAGSFLAWWEPRHFDPLVRESLDPVAPALGEAMDWVRAGTPKGAVFIAAPGFAPAVSVLGGRRVLRAPGIVAPADDERRLRAERAILAGRPVPDLVRRYGLGYVFAAPGDFREHGLLDPGELEGRGGLRRVYASDKGLSVYAIPRDGPAAAVK